MMLDESYNLQAIYQDSHHLSIKIKLAEKSVGIFKKKKYNKQWQKSHSKKSLLRSIDLVYISHLSQIVQKSLSRLKA